MAIRTTQEPKATLKSTYVIPDLPLPQDLESKAVMRKTKEAARALAELKGVALSMPNQHILISTLSLQEAKDSSEVENIITTNDELYQSDALAEQFASTAAKEVHHYAAALRDGFAQVKARGILTNALIKAMQAELEGNDAGFRTQGGTALKNDRTQKIVYTPPQTLREIEAHMQNLERFVNDDELCDWDALVKMAVIHHQFESIHPFFDGNGRTGRIINILYLVKQGLLDTPILYLSRYINQNKAEYYRLLQSVRDTGEWEEWVLFVLEGVKVTSYQTIRLIETMKELMQKHKRVMRAETKIYSQELLNHLFSHPYTKINHVKMALHLKTRKTAAKYLEELVGIGLLHKLRIGRENYYINSDLMECLRNVHDL
ncbi:MAG: Fic family protein [Alphaproteobacteria bacterium]|nr:Fic family protein [Alphaproteobacteria bacterium]